jgi:hypothetical protein
MRKTLRPVALLVLALALAAPAAALAQTQTEPPASDVGHDLGPLYLRAELQNLFIWRNDTDFDRSRPEYDENGQSAGAFATVLKPVFVWNVTDHVRIYYETEIGLNYWSKNNPDQQDAQASDVFTLKQRELWASGEFLDESLGLKLGYGRFRDPTGLWLNHWIGAAQAWMGEDETRLGLFVGQLPELTHEGIDLRENNFARDIFVYGARFDMEIDRGWRLASALQALYDGHQPGRERWLVVPSLHLEAGEDELTLSLDALLQVGQAEGRTLDGSIQDILAWSGQAHLSWDITEHFKAWPSKLEVNALFLSPDDAYAGNGWQHAALHSAKNRSATLMLTEDEIRDWYDNVDERMSGFEGGFYQTRAGLFVGDVDATWRIAEEVWQLHLILGAATVLKPENALDNEFVGFEADLVSVFEVEPYLLFHVAFGLLVPGGAGGVLLNRIDPDATDLLWMAEISATVRY